MKRADYLGMWVVTRFKRCSKILSHMRQAMRREDCKHATRRLPRCLCLRKFDFEMVIGEIMNKEEIPPV